jgi:1,4-alpha-glucan branching enzyme
MTKDKSLQTSPRNSDSHHSNDSYPAETHVNFSLPTSTGAEHAQLLGEFSDWRAIEMKRVNDNFVATVTLRPGRSYRFRFFVDGHRWENAWNADDYVANEFGGFDSVIHVPHPLASAVHRSSD